MVDYKTVSGYISTHFGRKILLCSRPTTLSFIKSVSIVVLPSCIETILWWRETETQDKNHLNIKGNALALITGSPESASFQLQVWLTPGSILISFGFYLTPHPSGAESLGLPM